MIYRLMARGGGTAMKGRKLTTVDPQERSMNTWRSGEICFACS